MSIYVGILEHLYMWKRATPILWYITVLSMKRQNAERFLPLVVAALYVVTGDYPSLLHHLRILV